MCKVIYFFLITLLISPVLTYAIEMSYAEHRKIQAIESALKSKKKMGVPPVLLEELEVQVSSYPTSTPYFYLSYLIAKAHFNSDQSQKKKIDSLIKKGLNKIVSRNEEFKTDVENIFAASSNYFQLNEKIWILSELIKKARKIPPTFIAGLDELYSKGNFKACLDLGEVGYQTIKNQVDEDNQAGRILKLLTSSSVEELNYKKALYWAKLLEAKTSKNRNSNFYYKLVFFAVSHWTGNEAQASQGLKELEKQKAKLSEEERAWLFREMLEIKLSSSSPDLNYKSIEKYAQQIDTLFRSKPDQYKTHLITLARAFLEKNSDKASEYMKQAFKISEIGKKNFKEFWTGYSGAVIGIRLNKPEILTRSMQIMEDALALSSESPVHKKLFALISKIKPKAEKPSKATALLSECRGIRNSFSTNTLVYKDLSALCM